MPVRLKAAPDEPDDPAALYAAHAAYCVVWFAGLIYGFLLIFGWPLYWLAFALVLLAVYNAWYLPAEGLLLLVQRWRAPFRAGLALAAADLAAVAGIFLCFYSWHLLPLPLSIELIFVYALPVLLILVLAGVSPSSLWLKRLCREARCRAAAVEQGICADCGYNLHGLAPDGPCPECGASRESPSSSLGNGVGHGSDGP